MPTQQILVQAVALVHTGLLILVGIKVADTVPAA